MNSLFKYLLNFIFLLDEKFEMDEKVEKSCVKFQNKMSFSLRIQ